MSDTVRLTVNGIPRDAPVAPGDSLLTVLRERLGLTGAKPGCGEGACGACTVLMDGRPVRACVTNAEETDGREVLTIEGLASGSSLHPLQRAFLAAGAMQCGYCIPGMIMRAVALLEANPDPSSAEVADGLEGNVCRCGTYRRISDAIGRVAGPGFDDAEAEDVPVLAASLSGPWDLRAIEERDYFDVLPDGLVVVLPPDATEGGVWSTSAGAWIHVSVDGTVTAFTGKVDVGQDNRTALSQLVAEELRVPLERVRLVMGDTDVCPYDMGTFGSRSIPDAGSALRVAASSARGLLDAAPLRPGDRRVEVVANGPVTAPLEWRIAGTPAARRAATAIVTGAAAYPSDLTRPGMLLARVLRPPAHGATLRSIDVDAAEAIPGATVVREGDLVAVLAPDRATLGRAFAALRADWDVSPQVGEDDLVAHLRRTATEAEPSEGWGAAFRHETGDVERALARADVRLEATYTTAFIAHVPMETRAAIAEWNDERVTVRTGTQRPFGVREEVAASLGVDESRVRVIVPRVGGGFGGKHDGRVATEAAILARATGRPVKVHWSRREEFASGYLRPAAVIDVASGAASGRLVAWSFTNLNAGAAGIMSPYASEHERIVFQPADPPLPQGSYRALAATANNFARESHLDELALALGVDPLELRLAHLDDERLSDVLRAVADRAGYPGSSEPGRGVGIACGVEKDARVATFAQVRAREGGGITVERIVTGLDCGAIVNPDGLRNQIEGATIMGLGGALFERIRFVDGVITNGSMTDYRVPRFSDVPPIDVVLVDRPDIPSAGAGETPIIAVAPALATAIFAATGRRLRTLPLLPDGVVPE